MRCAIIAKRDYWRSLCKRRVALWAGNRSIRAVLAGCSDFAPGAGRLVLPGRHSIRKLNRMRNKMNMMKRFVKSFILKGTAVVRSLASALRAGRYRATRCPQSRHAAIRKAGSPFYYGWINIVSPFRMAFPRRLKHVAPFSERHRSLSFALQPKRQRSFVAFRPGILAKALVLGGLVAGLSASGEEENEWKQAGDRIPDAVLRTADNEPFSLREEVSEQPAVLIFYRGGWCPLCTAHLFELARVESELRERGFQILGISPDRPEKVRESEDAGDFEYRLLSDSDMVAARGFGIAFQVEDELVRTYMESHGIDLEGDSGRDHHMLPHPAVFVVDTGGIIRFANVNPDYRVRLSGEEILEAANSISRSNPGESEPNVEQ